MWTALPIGSSFSLLSLALSASAQEECDLCGGRGGIDNVKALDRNLTFLPAIEQYGDILGASSCGSFAPLVDDFVEQLANPFIAEFLLGLDGPVDRADSCAAFQTFGVYCGCEVAEDPCAICMGGGIVEDSDVEVGGTTLEELAQYRPTCGFYGGVILAGMQEGTAECSFGRAEAAPHCSCLTSEPTRTPTARPTTGTPTSEPTTGSPTAMPVTAVPTKIPTTASGGLAEEDGKTEDAPMAEPANAPILSPAVAEPTAATTPPPTTTEPTNVPTRAPATAGPFPAPTETPTTAGPSPAPTETPTTAGPTAAPTDAPAAVGLAAVPSDRSGDGPVGTATAPTAAPTATPSIAPTESHPDADRGVGGILDSSAAPAQRSAMSGILPRMALAGMCAAACLLTII